MEAGPAVAVASVVRVGEDGAIVCLKQLYGRAAVACQVGIGANQFQVHAAVVRIPPEVGKSVIDRRWGEASPAPSWLS